MTTPTEKMTTCDCCEREMCIEDLTDHHGEWLCSKCEDDMGLNEDEDEDDATCEYCPDKAIYLSEKKETPLCAGCYKDYGKDEEIPEYDADGRDIKCYWCNSRGCDTKVEEGVYIHKSCA